MSNPYFTLIRAELIEQLRGDREAPSSWYQMLEAYYMNNGLYDEVQQQLFENGIWTPGMKGLRNPAGRVVEFHVTHIWPGALDKALPIVAKNKRIIDPIKQVWAWSNWAIKKQLATRWFAMCGDWFCKVATRTASTGAIGPDGQPVTRIERVYFQNIKPEVVTDFDVDERGFVTYIRLDIPADDGKMHTEVWDKADGYTLYVHDKAAGTSLTTLGDPVEARPLADFGVDFVPFVHAPFLDVGEKRGVGVFALALDKIDEANRMATRLHQLLFRFNKPTTAVMANANDANGRPLPPPRIANESDDDSGGKKSIEHDDDIRTFPGMSKMEYMVPPINWDAHLKSIDAQMREIEEDLPELGYYRLKELGANLSGRAMRTLLSQAVDRVIEARGNIEAALARANMMALTIGAKAGLFSNIGTYEAGDFEHTFAEREVIALSDYEQAETIKAETGSGIPLLTSVRRNGWSEAEINQMQKDQKAENEANQASLAQALLEAERRRDQNLNNSNDQDGTASNPDPAGDVNA